MDLTVGAIVDGKVTGITKFGAFVALPENKSGMVHISEVASSFVNDIKDFLQEGQQVKVKTINIDQQGRINLSIKKAQPQEPRQQHGTTVRFRDGIPVRMGQEKRYTMQTAMPCPAVSGAAAAAVPYANGTARMAPL